MPSTTPSPTRGRRRCWPTPTRPPSASPPTTSSAGSPPGRRRSSSPTRLASRPAWRHSWPWACHCSRTALRPLAPWTAAAPRRPPLAEAYRRGLARAACQLPPDAAGGRHVYHRFVIGVQPPLDSLIKGLEARGVQCRRPVFRPLHRALGREGFPQADALWESSLSIPCFPALTDADARRVSEALVDAREKP